MSKMLHNVQCHICPLKWKCEYSADEESYKWTRACYYGPNKHAEITDNEYEKIKLATQNCPILKLLDVKKQ